MAILVKSGRIDTLGNTLIIKRYHPDYAFAIGATTRHASTPTIYLLEHKQKISVMGYLREELNAPRKESIASTGMTLLGIIWLLKNAKMGQKSVFAGYVKMNIISNTGYAERLRPAMKDDVNKRLCELLDAEPYENYPDFASSAGRIDLLRRMRTRDDHEEFTSFINPNYSWDTYLIDLLLDDNGALARAALEYLEGKGAEEEGLPHLKVVPVSKSAPPPIVRV